MGQALVSVSRIEQSVYRLRGCNVLLDSDLAALYEVDVKALNQAMLSGVLHSRRAVRVNVAIMRAFVRLRRARARELSESRRATCLCYILS